MYQPIPYSSFVYVGPEGSFSPSPVRTTKRKAKIHFNDIAVVPGSLKTKVKVNETYGPYSRMNI